MANPAGLRAMTLRIKSRPSWQHHALDEAFDARQGHSGVMRLFGPDISASE